MRRYVGIALTLGLLVVAGSGRPGAVASVKPAPIATAAPASSPASIAAAPLSPREESSAPEEEPDAETALAEIERLTTVDDIAALRAMDLPSSTLVRPSFIEALGTTAATATAEERARVVARLASFLRRDDLDGDRLYVYEALGSTGDASAIDVLERESSRRDLDETTVLVLVRELARLGAPQRSFRAAVQRLAESGPVTDDFDIEIRAELRRELAVQL